MAACGDVIAEPIWEWRVGGLGAALGVSKPHPSNFSSIRGSWDGFGSPIF